MQPAVLRQGAPVAIIVQMIRTFASTAAAILGFVRSRSSTAHGRFALPSFARRTTAMTPAISTLRRRVLPASPVLPRSLLAAAPILAGANQSKLTGLVYRRG